MSLWIKICGNTSPEDALLAAEAGADAVGFVFAPSPRQVTVERVAAIVPQLPREIEKIGVFVDASFAKIASAAEACGLTGVQLHFETPAEFTADLRKHFGPALRIIGVVRYPKEKTAGERAVEQRIEFASPFTDHHVDAVLVDSYSVTTRGGTGQSYDWGLAAVTLFTDTKKCKLAAGGLTPANVAEAIRILRPWGVDVVSGVEASPGRKDPEKVRQFIANARAFTLA